MVLTTIEAPATLPLSVADAKEFLHIAHSDDDGLIELLIRSAVSEIQNKGRICIGTHKLRVVHRVSRDKERYFLPRRAISFQAASLQFPASVAEPYVVTSMAGLSVATSCIVWKEDLKPYDKLNKFGELVIDYTAGLTDEQLTKDDANLMQAIRDAVADWYTNRGVGASLPPTSLVIAKKYWTPVVH